MLVLGQPGHTGGEVKIGTGALLGLGSSVLPGKCIGKWTIVGAGSVVINDVFDYKVVVGVPATIVSDIRDKNE